MPNLIKRGEFQLFRKEVYPRKSHSNLTQLIFSRYLAHPVHYFFPKGTFSRIEDKSFQNSFLLKYIVDHKSSGETIFSSAKL